MRLKRKFILSNRFERACRHWWVRFVWVLFSILFGIANSYADETLTLNAGTAEPFVSADGGGFYGELTTEIFSRLGIEAKVILLPSARSVINANQGIDDGVIGRISGMEKKYKNLIMIPVPVVTLEFVAYSRDQKITITGWDSFTPYSIGYIRGWYIYEKNLPRTKELTIVNNAEQLFKLLLNGRAELILFEYYRGTWWNERLNANVYIVGSPVAEKDMFMYIHKKHKNLVPKITAVLNKMKQDGTYQDIKARTLPKYIQ